MEISFAINALLIDILAFLTLKGIKKTVKGMICPPFAFPCTPFSIPLQSFSYISKLCIGSERFNSSFTLNQKEGDGQWAVFTPVPNVL